MDEGQCTRLTCLDRHESEYDRHADEEVEIGEVSVNVGEAIVNGEDVENSVKVEEEQAVCEAVENLFSISHSTFPMLRTKTTYSQESNNGFETHDPESHCDDEAHLAEDADLGFCNGNFMH